MTGPPMAKLLDGKRVLVTGGSRGPGQALSRTFTTRGRASPSPGHATRLATGGPSSARR